ncbi:RNA-binding protein 26 isoform X2 [Anabrus simplex]|uniref:RNA-binding protein 26 isoform X2 n=1 Tax=Anabrus simplex TaxID=316456 RepID=UPI0035A2760D
MIIDDQEAFKSWLTAVLEPLCNADPAALAKYVFALVKKDKPVAELRTSMIEQLDVFLQHETKSFVDLLFKTLETQVYDLPASVVTSTSASDANPAPVAGSPVVTSTVGKPTDGFLVQQNQSSVVSESLPPLNSVSAIQTNSTHQLSVGMGPLVNSTQTNGSLPASLQSQSLHKRESEPQPRPSHRKADSDKDDKGRPGRARHRSSPSPSRLRSRSRSWDRTRRSRSRDRERERERDRQRERDRSRAWRNKSPPPRRYDRDRRRSWSRSNSPVVNRTRSTANSRSRSRSPRYNHRGRYRNRSPPSRLSLSRSRSRSNEKGYCMRGDLCPYDHGNDPVVLEDVALSRVLSFGPNAASTHPIPPPGAAPAAALTSSTSAPAPSAVDTTEVVAPAEHTNLASVPPTSLGIDPPQHQLHHHLPHHHLRGPQPGNMEYNPDAPSMEPRAVWSRPPFRGGPQGIRGGMMRGAISRPMPYNPQPQRELISVPVTDQTQNYAGYKRPHQPENNSYSAHLESKESPTLKRKTFDYNRLGPRHKNPNNCSLELKKVPRGMNNITHLNNHFAKFGKIVNIQVSYEGDPEAALVTFSTHAEANAAYRSTEAVLNNRFIKVFWHNSANNELQGKQENVPPPRPSVKERLGVPNPIQSTKVLNTLQPKATLPQQQEPIEKVIMSGNNLTKTVYIPTALKKAESLPAPVVAPSPVSAVHEANKAIAAAVIKKSQEMLAVKETLKKKQEEKRKEAIKLTADLRKRKQELLDKQLVQQKQLIERLEKGGVTGEQRDSLMSTIKTLQESIEKIRKDLAAVVTSGTNSSASSVAKPGLTNTLVKKSKEEAQREILDAELDLFTRQQEGGDTSELQKKVAELKMEAHSLGLLPNSSSHSRPHRGALHVYRGATRGLTRTTRGATFRGRGRGFAHVSVDHRPTKVLVSGYEEDEKTEVLAHFAQYGEIVDYVADDSTPSIVLNYKSRKEAELAMLKGRTFQDRLLSVTWCSNQSARNVRGGHSLMSTVHLHHGIAHRSVIMVGANRDGGEELLEDGEEGLLEEEEELGVPELSEDVLLQDDEEEEEDGEDRSWRR